MECLVFAVVRCYGTSVCAHACGCEVKGLIIVVRTYIVQNRLIYTDDSLETGEDAISEIASFRKTLLLLSFCNS